jgi:hypothetical protein
VGSEAGIEARRAASARARADIDRALEALGARPEQIASLRPYFGADGRCTQIPAQRAKRMVLLDLLAQAFVPGRLYSEARVNLILGRVHPDWAALRRYLVDEGFLDRRDGMYWRTGGTFDVG